MSSSPNHGKPHGITHVAIASPSLALVKYWGKSDDAANIPAVPSLAVTLDGLTTRTVVTLEKPAAPTVPGSSAGSGELGWEDSVRIDDEILPPDRNRAFFAAVRNVLGAAIPDGAVFRAESSNSFPTAAGLASSSSGFAALAAGCFAAVGRERELDTISAVARVGSASAARSVYGGFVTLRSGAEKAEPLFGPDHWPDLRVVVAVLHEGKKEVASRSAMRLTRDTSPFYRAWVDDSHRVFDAAVRALADRDIERLGDLMRLSYLRMFGTMFSADPPVFFWRPESVAVIRECARLRSAGVGVWETMDAGPQVKMVTTVAHLSAVKNALDEIGVARVIECRAGAGVTIET